MPHKMQPDCSVWCWHLASGSKGQNRNPKNVPLLLLDIKVDQNIFLPEACFACTISEPEFKVCFSFLPFTFGASLLNGKSTIQKYWKTLFCSLLLKLIFEDRKCQRKTQRSRLSFFFCKVRVIFLLVGGCRSSVSGKIWSKSINV